MISDEELLKWGFPEDVWYITTCTHELLVIYTHYNVHIFKKLHVCVHVISNVYCGRWSHEGESWYHKRSVTPISVLKAGHVEHLPQCIFFIICGFQSLSLSF